MRVMGILQQLEMLHVPLRLHQSFCRSRRRTSPHSLVQLPRKFRRV